jgi:AcrR family transcriptional regulator
MPDKKRKPRVFRSGDERRGEVIEAAFHCLQESGYAKLSARKIADRAGISLGQLTYYFKDMREVLVETYRHASLQLFEATQQGLSDAPKSPTEQLRVFLETGFTRDFLRRDYLRVRIDLWSAALTHEEIAAVERELYERYRLHLKTMIEAVAGDREVPAASIAMLVDTIMAMLDGLWLDWERRGSEAAVRNGLDASMLLVEYVMSRTKPPQQYKP